MKPIIKPYGFTCRECENYQCDIVGGSVITREIELNRYTVLEPGNLNDITPCGASVDNLLNLCNDIKYAAPAPPTEKPKPDRSCPYLMSNGANCFYCLKKPGQLHRSYTVCVKCPL